MGVVQVSSRPSFAGWLFELDRILRGEVTRPADLRLTELRIPVIGITVVVCVLAIVYGFCMGVFALVHGAEHAVYQRALLQTFASMCKVPLLFLLTLVITFPSLYVFNALVGSQLRILSVLKLLIASLAVNLSVLASMGPILAFFSVSTPNYPFIVLLNVLIFTVAGVLGLSFLVQTLNRLSYVEEPVSHVQSRPTHVAMAGAPIAESASVSTGPLDRVMGVRIGRHVQKVFVCWIVVFGLVGAQMGWVLRPFIGSPNQPFQWFRTRESNFFEAVLGALQNCF